MYCCVNYVLVFDLVFIILLVEHTYNTPIPVFFNIEYRELQTIPVLKSVVDHNQSKTTSLCYSIECVPYVRCKEN